MNAVIALPTSAEKAFADQFRTLGGEAAAPPARAASFARFAAAGLPHRRIEAWHYTDLRSLWRDALPPAAPAEAAGLAAAQAWLAAHAAAGPRLVLLDGRLRADLSDVPAGVAVADLATSEDLGPDLAAALSLGEPEAVVALNGALLSGGALVSIAPGTRLAQPLTVLSLATGAAPATIYSRLALRVGAGATATLVERYVQLGTARTDLVPVVLMTLGDGARLDHAVDIGAGARNAHLGTQLIRLGGESRLLSVTYVAAPGLTRRMTYLDFTAPGAEAHLRGVALLDGEAHADTTLIVTHSAPHCTSRELYKHVLGGASTGVYQGKVIVAPGAQKTDGKMLSKAVFLGDDATMYNKPELEIFADDVVCGHGATVGALDEDQLFYLRARGIPLAEAQAMLLEAFAAEPIEDLADEGLRDTLSADIADWLRRRGSRHI